MRGQGHSDPKMKRDTLQSQDAPTHQIWNSYLKEYRRYAPDTKRDGRTDGQCDYYKPPSSFGGIKTTLIRLFCRVERTRFVFAVYHVLKQHLFADSLCETKSKLLMSLRYYRQIEYFV